jgi:hypothetical protein
LTWTGACLTGLFLTELAAKKVLQSKPLTKGNQALGSGCKIPCSEIGLNKYRTSTGLAASFIMKPDIAIPYATAPAPV